MLTFANAAASIITTRKGALRVMPTREEVLDFLKNRRHKLMELFEKLNAFAKTAADKTNELVEDTRLKTQILNDEKSIRELERKIGAYYYKKFAAGESVDEAVSEYCTAISVHNANIEEKKAALAKEAKEEASASEDAPAEEVSEPEEDPFE